MFFLELKRFYLFLFLTLIVLTGCASVENTRIKFQKTTESEFKEFVNSAKNLVEYKPYKNLIYYDADTINMLFHGFVSSLDSSMEKINIRWGYNQEKQVEEELSKTELKGYQRDRIMSQIKERSWAVIKLKDSADIDSAGLYHMPVAFAAYVWKYHPVVWYGDFLMEKLEIKKEKKFNPNQPKKNCITKKTETEEIPEQSGNSDMKGDAAEPGQRLEKLKDLLEKGLIDSLDYRNKKKEILEDI